MSHVLLCQICTLKEDRFMNRRHNSLPCLWRRNTKKKKLRNIIVVYKVIKIHFNLLIFCLRYKAVQLSKHIRCDGCYQIDGRLLFMCAINGWIFIILSVLELFFLMNWFVLIVKTFFFASLSCWIIFFWNITYRTRV